MSSDSDIPESGSRVGGVASACTMALVGALVGALPTAYRTAAAGGSVLDGFVMAAAVLLTLLLPLAWLQPKAARGYRGVVGPHAPSTLGIGLGIWASLAVLGLFALAAVLKAKTNHRGLGGATLGMVGAGWLVIAAVAAARIVNFGRSLLARGVSTQLVRGLAALVMAVPVGFILAALVRGGDGGPLLAALFDLALLWLLVIAAMWRPLPEALERAGRYVALPLAVAVLLVGWLRVELSASTEAVKRGGGVVASALTALEMWSDRDGDGHGAHFGGRDCDEGDPRRFPGAAESAGDSIDSDCDGSDPPGELASVTPPPALPNPAGNDGADPAAPAVSAASSAATGSASTSADTPPETAVPRGDQPDIIVVTLDTVRADHTSLYGYSHKTTPGLDKLAERAVVFEHTYAIGNTTQRALMPLVSGLPLTDTPRSRLQWPRIKDEADTLAEQLGRVGYASGAVTSFTWLRKDRGFAQGFDYFDESAFRDNHPERKSTSKGAIDAAISVYQSLAKQSKPLYLWVHLFDAHSLYLQHEGFTFGRGDSGAYDSEIGFVDQQLSRLVNLVDKGSRAGRTIWLVHGSHGEALGEHKQEGHGSHIYEEMVRVPLLISVPGVKAGRYGRDAVSTLDIPATILDFAGAPRSKLPGVTLRPIAAGDLNVEREPVWTFARKRLALYDWPLKLRVFQRGGNNDRLLLFDLAVDPGETKDLSAERKDDLRRLAKLYETRK